MDFDIQTIVTNLIVFIAGNATLWLFAKTYKNSKDLNVLFPRLRKIEEDLYGSGKDKRTD